MRKIIAALLLVLFSASAVCGEAGLGEEPVSITFWHSASDHAGVLVDQYIESFNASNPYGITVTGVYQGQYSDATTLMKTIISAENYDELPDVMQIDATGKLDYLNSSRAFTVDDAEAFFGENLRDDYREIALNNWQYGGIQLGLPFATSSTITYYNRDMLQQAGWDHCPETFADVIRLSEDMKAAGIEAAAYGMVPNTPTLANWLGQMGSDLVNNANGTEAAATALACIDNGALEQFLTEWKAFYESGALLNAGVSANQFVAGEVALYTTSSSSVYSVLSKVNGIFEVGTGMFLRVNGDVAPGSTASGSCLCMFDSGNDLKKAAAWEFVKYMTGTEIQTDYAIGTGYTPACKAAAESPEYTEFLLEHPQFAAAMEQLAVTPAEMRSVTVGPAVDFYNAIMSGISDMLTEDQSPAECAEALAETLQDLLDNWNRLNAD